MNPSDNNKQKQKSTHGDEEKKDETSAKQTSQKPLKKLRLMLPTTATTSTNFSEITNKREHIETEPLLISDLHVGLRINDQNALRLRIDVFEVKPRRKQGNMARLGMNDITGQYIEGHVITEDAIAQLVNVHPSSDIEIRKFVVKHISNPWKNSIATMTVHFTDNTEIFVHTGVIEPYMPPAAAIVEAMEPNKIKDVDAVLYLWEHGETNRAGRYVNARLILFGDANSQPSRIELIGWKSPSDRVPTQICAVRINNVLTNEYRGKLQLRMTSCTTIIVKEIGDPLAQEMLEYFTIVQQDILSVPEVTKLTV
jgi:hypothetical protein